MYDRGSGYPPPVVTDGPHAVAVGWAAARLGIRSPAIVVTCLIFTIGIVIAASITIQGTPPPWTNQQVATRRHVGDWLVLLTLGRGLVGFSGWVAGFVAIRTDRGNRFGTAAILGGLVGPVVAFYAVTLGLTLSATMGNG